MRNPVVVSRRRSVEKSMQRALDRVRISLLAVEVSEGDKTATSASPISTSMHLKLRSRRSRCRLCRMASGVMLTTSITRLSSKPYAFASGEINVL
jgi:hypothetical protein